MRSSILVVLLALVGASAIATPPQSRPPALRSGISVRMMGLPLSFEANRGQFDPCVRFVTRTRGATTFLTDHEAVMVLPGRPIGAPARNPRDPEPIRRGPGAVLRMRLVGAAKAPASAGVQKLPGIANYFIGNNPKKWRTRIPTYRQARFAGVYPGTDLVYYGNPQRLEYDFVLKPGANPKRIKLAFAGAERLRLAANGDLIVTTTAGDVRWNRPYAYQMDGARRVQVACDYSLAPGSRGVGFRLARYDAARPLVVDPSLGYSTFLGGASDEYGRAIALDSAGAAYVTGQTRSTAFPKVGALQTGLAGLFDAFVTKLNAAGTDLVYSTYVGGSWADNAKGIAVDSTGAAYIAGLTSSINFPTRMAFQYFLSSKDLSADAFVAKLSPDGSTLVYSTYLGGSLAENVGGIAVDSAGAAYVTGYTKSTNFPLSAAPLQSALSGGWDAFISKLYVSGAGLEYSTYFGGSAIESGNGIAVDSTGAAYVTGRTTSSDMPVTAGALQTVSNGNDDAFILKLDASGSALTYSTYLGSSSIEEGIGICIDSSGAAYVTGYTYGSGFPTTPGAYQRTKTGTIDAFVTKLNAAGSAMDFSTFLGGTGDDGGGHLALAPDGVWVVGDAGAGFPTSPDAYQPTFGGGVDAFLARLDSVGSALLYATYLGGSGTEKGADLAADAAGNVVLTGYTGSASFPATGYQTTYAGSTDAVVVKVLNTARTTLVPSAAAGEIGATVTLTVTLTAGGSSLAGKTVAFTVGGVSAGSATTDGDGQAAVNYTIPAGAFAGTQTISASFIGDTVYAPTSGSSTLTINGFATTLAAADASGEVGATVSLSATLTSGGAALAGKTVSFTVGGVSAGSGTTDASGVATLSYTSPAGASVGEQTIGAAFSADATHAASSASATLSLSKRTTSLAAADVSGRRGRTVSLTATLTANGSGVAGKSVDITVDGTAAGTGTTNAQGVATVAYSVAAGVTLGGHAIAASFAGDANSLGSTGSGTLTVQAPARSTWVYASPRSAAVGYTVTLGGELFDATQSGVKLAGKTLAFAVDGVPAGSAVTTSGSGGSAHALLSFSTTGLSVGSHTILATFAGDADYDGSSSSATLTVGKVVTYVTAVDRTTAKGSTITLKGTLSKNGGYVIGATLTFKVDGTSVGTGTTDANGIAALSYTASDTAGAHTLVTEYAGSATLAASSSTNTLTVQGIATRIYVPAVSKAYYDSALIGGQLLETATGTKLNGKTLAVQIDGASIGTATTTGGQATVSYMIPTSLSVGDHTITVSFAGDAGYAASSQTGTLTVGLATPRLTVTSPSVNAGSKVQLVAVLTRNGGYAPGRTVTFKVDGTVVGTATTNAGGKGLVIYTAALSAGSHTLTAEFAGDGALKPASASGTLTVIDNG